MAKKVYLLFNCDEWITQNSMTPNALVGVFTSITKLRTMLRTCIRRNDMCFAYHSDWKTSLENFREFNKEFPENNRMFGDDYITELNKRLMYGHVKEVTLNEEL